MRMVQRGKDNFATLWSLGEWTYQPSFLPEIARRYSATWKVESSYASGTGMTLCRRPNCHYIVSAETARGLTSTQVNCAHQSVGCVGHHVPLGGNLRQCSKEADWPTHLPPLYSLMSGHANLRPFMCDNFSWKENGMHSFNYRPKRTRTGAAASGNLATCIEDFAYLARSNPFGSNRDNDYVDSWNQTSKLLALD